MNKPKTLDNRAAQAFVADYLNATELCEAYREADDIFSGVLALGTAGNTATRSLSRKTLFRIIRWCPVISVDAVNAVMHGRYAASTTHAYAALARVLSMALQGLAERSRGRARPVTVQQERERIDAPYEAELRLLLARPAVPDPCPPDPLKHGRVSLDQARMGRMQALAELADG